MWSRNGHLINWCLLDEYLIDYCSIDRHSMVDLLNKFQNWSIQLSCTAFSNLETKLFQPKKFHNFRTNAYMFTDYLFIEKQLNKSFILFTFCLKEFFVFIYKPHMLNKRIIRKRGKKLLIIQFFVNTVWLRANTIDFEL